MISQISRAQSMSWMILVVLVGLLFTTSTLAKKAKPRPKRTKKGCPRKQPKRDSNCHRQQRGINCDYDYRYLGCSFENGYSCPAFVNAQCTAKQLWELNHLVTIQCINTEPNSPVGTCEPCPRVQPEDICPAQKPTPGTECDVGEVDCSYDFKYTGSSTDDLECTPEHVISCANGRWTVLCPEALSDTFSSCRAEQVGLECHYNHIYTGCTFSEGFECTPVETATCGSDLRWSVTSIIVAECADPDPGSPSGNSCEPCAEVEPVGICPAAKPIAGQPCNIEGDECKYDNVLAGCTASTLQCTPLNLMSCISGVWREAVAGVEQCV